MTTITTDYTTTGNPDSLTPGSFSSYRFAHWLSDTIKNMFSDPVNIHDTRVSNLLNLQDSGDNLQALFKVGVPFNPKDRKSGDTPCIIVSVGGVSRPLSPINNLGFINRPLLSGVLPDGGDCIFKTVQASVMIVTESYDGTMLLTDIIYDFLCINSRKFLGDNRSLIEFTVTDCSGPQQLQQDQANNAEPLYQASISVKGTGNVSFTRDTQGPVFRGLRINGATADALNG